MSIPGSAELQLLASSASAQYTISRSLRFNSSDSAYLSRTPASAGNRKTWTWSGWVKRSALGTNQRVFTAAPSDNDQTFWRFDSSDRIEFYASSSPVTIAQYVTTAVYRDPSSWYHVVIVFDTTNATSSDRVRIYVNGQRVTVFTTTTAPTQNADGSVNNTVSHMIGRYPPSAIEYFSGYLAECHLIDGSALDASSFGETNSVTGQWVPKAYTGTYGTNGFKLTFSDNSNTTATTLGKDTSGNGNNFTPTNFSVAAGAGNDSLVDTPTSYGTDTGAGGEVRGNYCTWNPVDGATLTLSNGNLQSDRATGTYGSARGTIGVSSGKWYWEVTSGGGTQQIGIFRTTASLITDLASSASGYVYIENGQKYNNGTGASYGASYTTNDVIGVALDLDAGTLVFYKNGASQGTAYSGLTGSFAPAVAQAGTNTNQANFGQRPWAYTPPANHRPLVDTCLPAPVVAKASSAFDVKLYTGNGSTQTISGLGFSPDLVWIKDRSASIGHALYDTVRGALNGLCSNSTTAELVSIAGRDLTGFTSDGFTLGNTYHLGTNTNNNAHVAWCFDAGTTTSSNVAGSITSQVRANASAGFSIVTWTGNGTAGATVGHGLGAKPFLRIIKRRDAASTIGWMTFHESAPTSYFTLNSTNAATPASEAAPTSTVFSLPADANSNANGGTYVAYCFAPVAGYSAMGSFSTVTSSTDGVFVYTNHRPRWVLIKKTSATGPWIIYDAVRNTYNAANNELRPNTSEAENGGAYLGQIDILSNGFKIRSNSSAYVGEAGDFIYCSFAESPFAYSRAR